MGPKVPFKITHFSSSYSIRNTTENVMTYFSFIIAVAILIPTIPVLAVLLFLIISLFDIYACAHALAIGSKF